MFSFLKKKKSKNSIYGKIIDDPVFGKLKFIPSWRKVEPIELSFYGKTLEVDCYALTNAQAEEPNDLQRAAFARFMTEKESLMKDCEKLLTDFFNPADSFDMSDAVFIISIDISREGKCLLFMLFNEQYLFDFDLDELGIEHGQDFGVLLFPELKILRSSEKYLRCLNGTEQ